jgi:cyclophilin family peptidyl-prolyl cis-trans isomerase
VTGLLFFLAATVPLAQAQGEKASPAPPLQVTVERLGNFAYAGDPVLVRIAVFNTSKAPYDNSKGIDLLGDMVIGTQASGTLKHKTTSSIDLKEQPAVIAAGGFFGFIADLRDVVEGLDKPGNYAARFQRPDLDTETVPLVVIPRYDPAVAYRATMETDYGTLQFDMFGKEAPSHVHNFYDLGNQGYYDGTLFHVIVKGIEARGGDRTGNGESSPGYSLKPEIDKSLKHIRGTLSMLGGESSDHGSQFLISLAESSGLDGKMTIFGALAGGQDALTAIENLPTNGQKSFPFYRPLKEARIHSIRLTPSPAGSKATSQSAATATSKP